MTTSKRIAGILGPTLMVVIASEFPLVQPHLYDEQIPPVVYLSGVIAFVAGLTIVRSHNFWQPDWTVLVTFTGWLLLLLGLVRMFGASVYVKTAADTSQGFFMLVEGLIFVVGLFMTFKAYSRSTPDSPLKT